MNTREMEKLELGMTNFDGTIDDGFAEALQERPGEVMGWHSAWNFCGLVYFHAGKFREEVWVYGTRRETIAADTLQELMDAVNGRYGRA